MNIRPHDYVDEFGRIYEWKLRETMRSAPVVYHRILAQNLLLARREEISVLRELMDLLERVRRARYYMDHLPGGATVAELAYIRRLLDGGGR